MLTATATSGYIVPYESLVLAVHTKALRGTIRLSTDDVPIRSGFALVADDGDTYLLRGPVAELLANARGMEVWVTGDMTGAREMTVRHFAFRDVRDGEQPLIKILPDQGRPCADPTILLPVGGNPAVWTWKR